MAGPVKGEIWCYVDSQFRGELVRYAHDTDSFGKYNDKFTSFKVGPDTTVILFADAGFKGKNKVINGEVSHIGSDFNDKVSSLLILPGRGEVVFYVDANFRGASHSFTADVAHLGGLKLGDKFSSLKTDPATSVEVFEHGDFKGKSKIYSGAVASFGDLNDKISSFKIRK